MKKAILATYFFLVILIAGAQDWNPYVKDGTSKPATLLPMEFNGIGNFLFHIGNNGNKPLALIKNQEMTLVITLSYGNPGHTNPLSAIGGTWADKFNWTYDESLSTFFAIQNQEIPPNSDGLISIKYKTTINSPETNPSNGFNVNLQPPPYCNGVNLSDDDYVNYFTFVQAKDFSDAPSSYGIAIHEINTYKNPETEEYDNYLFLGHSVDPETTNLPSKDATGDDNNMEDDEDGVIFPKLVQSDTVNIPVIVTVHDFGTGLLNAWFDWNGDGDFADFGEQISEPKTIFTSDTVKITVVVPANAITTKPTFSRFRLGNNNVRSALGLSAWGEVEDYQINISEAPKMAVTKRLKSNKDIDHSGTLTMDDILTYSVTITNKSDSLINNLTINSDKLSFSKNNYPSLAAGKSCAVEAIYNVKQEDLNIGNIKSTIIIGSDQTKPICDTVILFQDH